MWFDAVQFSCSFKILFHFVTHAHTQWLTNNHTIMIRCRIRRRTWIIMLNKNYRKMKFWNIQSRKMWHKILRLNDSNYRNVFTWNWIVKKFQIHLSDIQFWNVSFTPKKIWFEITWFFKTVLTNFSNLSTYFSFINFFFIHLKYYVNVQRWRHISVSTANCTEGIRYANEQYFLQFTTKKKQDTLQ